MLNVFAFILGFGIMCMIFSRMLAQSVKTLKMANDNKWVNGVEPCPPIGKMHKWEVSKESNSYQCSKCGMKPSEIDVSE